MPVNVGWIRFACRLPGQSSLSGSSVLLTHLAYRRKCVRLSFCINQSVFGLSGWKYIPVLRSLLFEKHLLDSQCTGACQTREMAKTGGQRQSIHCPRMRRGSEFSLFPPLIHFHGITLTSGCRPLVSTQKCLSSCWLMVLSLT